MFKDIIIATLVISSAASSIIAYKAVKELKASVEGLKTKVDSTDKSLKNELRNEIRKQFYHIAFIRFRP